MRLQISTMVDVDAGGQLVAVDTVAGVVDVGSEAGFESPGVHVASASDPLDFGVHAILHEEPEHLPKTTCEQNLMLNLASMNAER